MSLIAKVWHAACWRHTLKNSRIHKCPPTHWSPCPTACVDSPTPHALAAAAFWLAPLLLLLLLLLQPPACCCHHNQVLLVLPDCCTAAPPSPPAHHTLCSGGCCLLGSLRCSSCYSHKPSPTSQPMLLRLVLSLTSISTGQPNHSRACAHYPAALTHTHCAGGCCLLDSLCCSYK